MQKLLQLTALLTLLSSCSSGPTLTDQASGEFSAQGLYQVQSSGFTSAYVHPDAGLPAYRTVNIEQLDLSDIEIGATTVTGTLRRDWQMTPERESSLQSVWGDAMNRAFGDYERATSGEETLRISAAITRVAPGRPTATTVGGGLQPMGSSQDVVEIFMEFRLYNQDSGQLLAVIRDSRTMISQAMSRTGPVAVQTMFRSWAALLHTRVSGR
jgi:hypothetical protein